MARQKLIENVDLFPRVRFVGTSAAASTHEDRAEIVQELLSQWSDRAHRRGRPARE